MNSFLFEYGLFATKTLTIIIAIIIIGIFIIAMLYSKKKHGSHNYITTENINEKFDDFQDSLEAEILSDAEYKKLQKIKKKSKKIEEKSAKKSKNANSEPRPRLFVITFNGDLHASATEHLREEISAILTIATPQDEVLVKLESCGGVVHNYGLAAAQLQRIKEHNINLTVSVDLVAASGGYMMACVANKIIAAPFAILGSIGVLAQLPNFNKLLQKHDIEIEHHTSGEYKTTLTMLGKNNQQGREKFIAELKDTHDLFKEFVKLNRPQIDLSKVATGEYWYGLKALELNLIDQIKLSDDYLIEKTKQAEIYAIEYKIHQSFKEKITNALAKGVEFCLSKISNKPVILT